ncbi:hypothetical protein RPB_1946 [Rhodopseudomonas palustris HaA2]|uniref:Secreted protein n=1 Tax=Rhodopseudomonas palustris (strain HaA2) TaxID=316058 RepID=Q2IYQ6_RHOP2|nr:hypothetical protein RPB_1946 [Rhodopseudomonas palustris HaA2]
MRPADRYRLDVFAASWLALWSSRSAAASASGSSCASPRRRPLTRNNVCTLLPTVAQPPRMFGMIRSASLIVCSSSLSRR